MPQSVDRPARDCAAQILRSFMSGQMDQFAFEQAQPITTDPVIGAIWDTVWAFYCDFRRHRLTGRDRLAPAMRREWQRWILFLDSGHPYVWPDLPMPGLDPRHRTRQPGWRGRWKGGLAPHQVQAFLAAGHFAVWPFRTVSDFRHALATPRRLSGKKTDTAATEPHPVGV